MAKHLITKIKMFFMWGLPQRTATRYFVLDGFWICPEKETPFCRDWVLNLENFNPDATSVQLWI